MNTADIPVVELSGTPRQRGQAYGEAVKLLIATVVERWKSDLGNFGGGRAHRESLCVDNYLNAFFAQTNYLPAIERWSSDLLDEVKGIAEAANQDFHTLLALQLMDEEWIFGLGRNQDKPISKCTAFGLSNQDKGISYAGQNMDIPSWTEGSQVLLRVMPENGEPEALVFSIAGHIGLNGMNISPLGVTCNTMAQLNYAVDGLPVSFIMRSILARHNIDDAAQFLHMVKHASGQNYILSSDNGMRCFECSGSRVVEYVPSATQGRVFHTNHPLVNSDQSDLLPPAKRINRDTVARLNSISHRLGEMSKAMDLEDIKAALSAHDDPENPVSRSINPNNIKSSIGYTAGSSIYEFGVTPKLHLAPGPPCKTDFQTFIFSQI